MLLTYLIRDGFDLGGCQQNLQFFDAKVADTNAPASASVSRPPRSENRRQDRSLGKACSLDIFHLRPGRWNVWLGEPWVVDEIQVNIFNPKLLAV